METMAERIEKVQNRIINACAQAGRQPDSVKLLAVSKTFGPAEVKEAADCGLTLFGESKIQEAEAKIPRLPRNLSWHLIGHLQSNKVRKAILLFNTIHSVDSSDLLLNINKTCDQLGRHMNVLLEVNVSGEASKFGITPANLPEVLETAAKCLRVDVVGLMTIPPWSSEKGKARPYFAKLRELSEKCRDEYRFPLSDLSMGMSHDLEEAIAEGATYVRVGNAIFGTRTASKKQEGEVTE